jgi:ABC-2 type transport system ATP-binding protein/Cu-processing system ATP-binding protein
VLSVRDLEKRLGGKVVLTGVSFDCAPSETCLFLGGNGSGKSTLLRLLVGLTEPDRGAVTVGGLPVNAPSGEARRRLGYLPDATDVLPDLSIEELVTLVQTLKRATGPAAGAAVDALRERLGLSPFWRQRLATLSFGQRKRACLLAALVGAPPLLVLDEPTNGLDAEGEALIRALIDERRRDGLATVVATNDRRLAAVLDATRFRLVEGRLVAHQRDLDA